MTENIAAKRDIKIPAEIDFIRISWCDNANVIRAKAVYKDSLKDSNCFVGISEGQQGVPAIYDAIVEGSGLTPVGEVRLIPDFSSFTPLPYSAGHARVMADMTKDGETWEYCPRGFLKKMMQKASKMGFSVQAAFENEFYLLKRTEEGLIIPSENTPFASTYSMDLNSEIISNIVEAIMLQGMEVQQYYPEAGSSQHEITIKYTGALNACDNQIAFRETVKAISCKHGLVASFLPKVFADQSGSGCHLHLSLWKNGENIFTDSRAEYGISETGNKFMAGVLYHLPALMAVTTPIPNSYRRIIPHGWIGAFNCWGINNREAAVRVIREPSGDVKNFELKTIDASSNPYLALGAVIAAGIDGIRHDMDLAEPVQQDPANILEKNHEIEPLPSDLSQAIVEFKKDKVLSGAMGKKLSKAYIAVKKAEFKAMGNLTLNEEVKLLIDKY